MIKVFLAIILSGVFLSSNAQVKWTTRLEEKKPRGIGADTMIYYRLHLIATIQPGYYLFSQATGMEELKTDIFTYRIRAFKGHPVTVFKEKGTETVVGVWDAYKTKVDFYCDLKVEIPYQGEIGFRVDYSVGKSDKDYKREQVLLDFRLQ